MNNRCYKMIRFTILMVWVILLLVLHGCTTSYFYAQPQLPDDQTAIICGSNTEFDDRTGYVSAVGITAVDSVQVSKDDGKSINLGAGYFSPQKISRAVTGDFTNPIRLMPGLRMLEISYRNFSAGSHYHLKEPIRVNLDCTAGHKYEVRFKKIDEQEIEVGIVDLDTEVKQAFGRGQLTR